MQHGVISNVWHNGGVLEDWKKALIVPLFKKGDLANIDNYRGISLLSLPGKVFAILLEKLSTCFVDFKKASDTVPRDLL